MLPEGERKFSFSARKHIPCSVFFIGTITSISTGTVSRSILGNFFGVGTCTNASPLKHFISKPAYLQLQEVVRGVDSPSEAGPYWCRGSVFVDGRSNLGPVGRLSVGPCDLDGPLGYAATMKDTC